MYSKIIIIILECVREIKKETTKTKIIFSSYFILLYINFQLENEGHCGPPTFFSIIYPDYFFFLCVCDHPHSFITQLHIFCTAKGS